MRILHIDDDPDIRALTARALAQEFPEADLRQASDPASLQQTLAEAPPNILVSDYDLRWGDGLAIFEQVCAVAPLRCAVMFTGTGNEELAVRAMKAGFDDYIVKGQKQYKRLAASVRIAYERAQARQKLEESRNVILKELYHRLHNNLQIVISLLRLTAKTMPDAASRGQIDDLGRRIQALSALQEEFYRSLDFRQVDFSAYLERLAGSLVGPQVQLDAKLDPVVLPVDVAVPLGLIANELITNVAKHAFPGDQDGILEIRLSRAGERIGMVVADNGIGTGQTLEAAPAGLGKQLVERLAAQLGATIEIGTRDQGTECRISLTL